MNGFCVLLLNLWESLLKGEARKLERIYTKKPDRKGGCDIVVTLALVIQSGFLSGTLPYGRVSSRRPFRPSYSWQVIPHSYLDLRRMRIQSCRCARQAAHTSVCG